MYPKIFGDGPTDDPLPHPSPQPPSLLNTPFPPPPLIHVFTHPSPGKKKNPLVWNSGYGPVAHAIFWQLILAHTFYSNLDWPIHFSSKLGLAHTFPCNS